MSSLFSSALSSEMMVNDQSLGPSQSFFLVDRRQLLSISFFRYVEKKVPIYVLVQQPSPILKYPYDACPKAFALVLKEKTVGCSYGKPFAQPFAANDEEIIADAVPLSIRLPSGYDFNAYHNNAGNVVAVKTEVQIADHLHQLSVYDRQRNWYISVRRRHLTGHKDTFYVHLQSDIQCRSLVEVYCFIIDGKRPTSDRLKAINEEMKNIHGGSKKLRGSRLVEKKEVGRYDHDNKFIYRWQTTLTESQTKTSEKAETSGSRKRKREEDISSQSGPSSQIANPGTSEPKLHPLYDFLLK